MEWLYSEGYYNRDLEGKIDNVCWYANPLRLLIASLNITLWEGTTAIEITLGIGHIDKLKLTGTFHFLCQR